MPRISELPNLTSLADDDDLVIRDNSTSTTKKFSLSTLVSWLQSLSDFVTTSMITDKAVTTRKFKPTTINSTTDGFVVQGVRFTTTSTSYVAVPGCSMNYTSGPTAERLFIRMDTMCYATPSTGEVALYVNGVGEVTTLYVDPATPWARAGQTYIIDVAANTMITLVIRIKAAGGTTCHITNEQPYWMPTLRGFSVNNQ